MNRNPALILAALLLFPRVASAQPTPDGAQLNGHDLLVEAGRKLVRAPDPVGFGGGADNLDPKVSPEENLRRERIAVRNNAAALALVRQALKLPIAAALPPTGVGDIEGLNFNARMRELARQFAQEADVRAVDGDFEGAMNSKLDCAQFGAALGRGSLIGAYVGQAVEAIGLRDAEKIAAHLDAKACHAAADRLDALEARRASLAQVLRDEQAFSTNASLQTLADIQANPNPTIGEEGSFPTRDDLTGLKKLTPYQLKADQARLFDALVDDAAKPYSTKPPVLPTDLNPLTKTALLWAKEGAYRFSFARTLTRARLLKCALILRAVKLDTDVYLDYFQTPGDPFSPDGKPLVYRKTDNAYLLYSVGPDGKDDGGEELQTIEKSTDAGVKVVTDRLRPDSTGDIVQKPF